MANSDLSLSCAVQLRSISDEEGGLTVPVVKWRVNGTSISEVRVHVIEHVHVCHLHMRQKLRAMKMVRESGEGWKGGDERGGGLGRMEGKQEKYVQE